MKMEVLAVQQQYQTQYGVLGSSKVRDWTSTLTPPQSLATNLTKTQTTANNSQSKTTSTTNNKLPYPQSNTTNKIKNSISKKSKPISGNNGSSSSINSSISSISSSSSSSSINKTRTNNTNTNQSSYTHAHAQHYTPQNININTNNLFYCDDLDAAAVDELSMRLLDELRAAKSRHLTCTEVSLPCDLTPRIAAEIIRVSEKEACGIRGCTIYIEFEDEPNNSRRIAALKLDAETVSTFEVYLTLRQDHRGWTALLPQFMKSLARTITISPEFTITKHKLYSPQQSSYRFGASSAAAAVPAKTATS